MRNSRKSNNRIVLNPFNDMPQSGLTTIIVYRTTDSNDGIVSYTTSTQADAYTLRNSNTLRTFLVDGTSSTSPWWQTHQEQHQRSLSIRGRI